MCLVLLHVATLFTVSRYACTIFVGGFGMRQRTKTDPQCYLLFTGGHFYALAIVTVACGVVA